MSRKTRSTLVLFGMISVLLVLIGCPTKKEIDLRSENAAITEIKVENAKVDITEALASSGWKMSVSTTTDSVTLTVKPEDDKATIAVTCNGTAVNARNRTEFTCSSLNKGTSNTIKVVVTAEKGNKSNTATIIVYRKSESEDTSLKTLKANNHDILQMVYKNTVTVDPVANATTGIVIIAAPKNEKASLSLKCNEAEIKADANDKTKFVCPLKEGGNKIILQVTAADGKTKEDISIDIHRYTLFEQDPSLKVLKADNRDILSLIASPITLDSVKNATTGIVITAEPKHNNAKVELKCNNVIVKPNADDKTKFTCPLKEGGNTITVQATAADGTTKGSLITINVHRNNFEDENSSLKSLKITEAPGFIFDGTKTEYQDIPVPYGNVHITATAYNNAEVMIDGKNSSDPGYGIVAISAAKLKVIVKVTKGGNSKEYTLNFIEAAHSVVNVEVLVVDSIGGTKVDGTTLKVFDASTNAQVGADIPVHNGIANVIALQRDQRYNFKLEGIQRQWAGSLIENYYISALPNQKLTMIQFPHGDHTRGVEPPKVASIMKVAADGVETPINDGASIDNSLKNIKVEFSSTVGAVEEKAWGGFGAKLGMGMIPNSITGIGGNNKGTTYSSPNFTSKYEFELKPGTGNFIFPNGNFDLIVVGYDIANNRVEKHISIKSENSAHEGSLENAKFDGMLILSRRDPYSAGIYSNDRDDITHVDITGKTFNDNPLALNPTDGRRTSYRSIMLFSFVDKNNGNHIPIIGFDLYRKKARTSDKFERVSRTIYGGSTTGRHQGFDTDSRLEENGEYEYKVIAYNASHTAESPVLTMKVMESFTYELAAPAKHALLTKTEAQNISYMCRVSNVNLLKKENADRFNSGLLVLDGQGGALFGSRFRYYYNRTYKDGNSGPDLLIDIVQNGKVYSRISYQDVLKDPLARMMKINSLEELIKVDSTTGEITLTPKFTRIGIFNVEEYTKGRALEYTAGTTYQWDMQDWGNNAYDLSSRDGDTPMLIIKDYKYTNPDGSIGSVQTQTWGNTGSNGANAINGRYTFTVTE